MGSNGMDGWGVLERASELARQGQAYTVDVVDVDADPDLVARYDELVPVLVATPAGTELCHYFLDEAALRRHLGLEAAAA